MRRYSFAVLFHVAGIILMSVGTYLLVEGRMWFCALTLFLLLLATAVHLYRLQMVQMRMMRSLAESLRHDDMMVSFRSPYRNRPMEEMAGELSEAMQGFRTRVLERNEMDAWQKLIRVLTHEIMNSITPILSLSETLSERDVDERNYAVMQQGMRTIYRRSKGLLEFVENYRKLTRLPAPVRRPVSVCELLSDLRKLYAADTGLHIRMPAEDMVLHIDRAQVEQDNGEGILPDVQDKVFVPFFTTKPGGSGIGLSLCRQIMNRHGGNITLQSAVGHGSCFTLLFP